MKQTAQGGRTHTLWVQYHYMIDVIKIYIRNDLLADHDGHLCCIVARILDVFLASSIIKAPKGHMYIVS